MTFTTRLAGLTVGLTAGLAMFGAAAMAQPSELYHLHQHQHQVTGSAESQNFVGSRGGDR